MSTPNDLRLAADAWDAALVDLAATERELTDTNNQLAVALIQEQADAELIDELRAEVKRLNDIIHPPPVSMRVAEPYGPDGGGGQNWVEVIGSHVFMGTDVGGVEHYMPGDWFAHKCNYRMSGRHMASGVAANGKLLVHGGAPGGQEGVHILDLETHEYSGPFTAGFVNSQNCYGDPRSTDPKAWKFGYGHRYVRSAGRLTYQRLNGSFVTAQFGYADLGKGGVCVTTGQSRRVIPGTETWACRYMTKISDAEYAVSVWLVPAGEPAALPSPGGLWRVNVDANTVTRMWSGIPEVEHTAIKPNGLSLVGACRYNGIWRDNANVTFNLPRAWWYCVEQNEAGDILAGCAEPAKGPDGKFWSFALLKAGSSTWINLTPAPYTGDGFPALAGGFNFRAVVGSNTLGSSGAIVTDVAWRGDIPICTASGILWAFVDGKTQPAPWGDGIIVFKDYDRSPSGRAAFACSDFRVMTSTDGIHWDKPTLNTAENEGMRVVFAGEDLYAEVLGGTRWVQRAGSSSFAPFAGAWPSKGPTPIMLPTVRAQILASPEVTRFGERYGDYPLDAETLIVYGHGALKSFMRSVVV